MSYRRTGALHEHRDREREGMRVATSSWMDPGANAQKPREPFIFVSIHSFVRRRIRRAARAGGPARFPHVRRAWAVLLRRYDLRSALRLS